MGDLESKLDVLCIDAGEAPLDQTDNHLNSQRRITSEKVTLQSLNQLSIEEHLSPFPSFGAYWTNQLQHVKEKVSTAAIPRDIPMTQTRTLTRFTREGLEGRVTGYKEISILASNANAKNSTSLLRKPAGRAEFVRGAAGFFPFSPGGLDGVEAISSLEDQALPIGDIPTSNLNKVINSGPEGGLLSVAPGLKRGIQLQKPDDEDVQQALDEPREDSDVELQPSLLVDEDDDEDSGTEDIDEFLPVEFPALAPRVPLASTRDKSEKEWAHMVDINRDIPNFREVVPDMAREYPFELDTFQKEAVIHLENGESVFVAAHTSAGKTVVAEYAIALAAKHMTKAIYTSPIKALSNQKFRDFRYTFDDVGILTGDVQIRPEANCLIMTTEILRSMLYRGADIIRDVEFVIFDEVHYVNDTERGVVWEEVIIMLPEHVTLILLSATVPNTYEFASWVGRTKKKNIFVISTAKRPVPLEHYIFAGGALHKIVDRDKKFIERGWTDANNIFTGRNKIVGTTPAHASRGDYNQRGGNRGQAPNNARGGVRGGAQRGGPQRGGAQRGSSAPGRGNITRTGRGGGRTTVAQDRNVWLNVVQHLRKHDLTPACIFVFSKKRCEENAAALTSIDYCTATEKNQIHIIIEKSLARLKPQDRVLPQVLRLRELLNRGLAVHHGGMLPILKEVVEILFAKTLVKVLFATETFAMGLNLPTRAVIFSGFRKHDGTQFRDLLPGEYTQMAGRAGRRGLDSVGYVILVLPGADEAPAIPRLRNMMLGTPTKLRSQFRLTYNMILNLLRVEALKIEEMIKRSFSENAAQALLPEHEKMVKLSEADLEKIKREPCEICDVDLDSCHNACVEYAELTSRLHLEIVRFPAGRRMFQARKLVVFRQDGVRKLGMLVRDGFNNSAIPTITVLEISSGTKRGVGDLMPYLGLFAQYFSPQPRTFQELSLKLKIIPISELECVTTFTLNFNATITALYNPRVAQQVSQQLFLPLCADWTYYSAEESDWGRIKNVIVVDILEARKKYAEIVANSVCLQCPQFVTHYAKQHDEWVLKESIEKLRHMMSDQNLQLLPDYEQRINVLRELNFVDENSRVELKGKVACEIHTADELVLTELILENVLASFEPEEIAGLLSAFVFEEKTESEPKLTSSLERGKQAIIDISERVNHLQTFHQVIESSSDSNDFVSKPRFGMVEVVYEWARGMSFNRIMDLTDVMEGTIVRVVTRLDETCREVKSAARIIGDPGLYQKMTTCQELIKRDVCATASLYM